MSYENAPATKMLATNCACCGRPLVDAKSVECGIGPDCREKYGVDVDVTEAAREEANKIVFQLARGGLTREDARPLFDKLAALGFVVLAERVAKRFRTTLTARMDEAELRALRAEYARIRAFFCYDSCDEAEFNGIVKSMLGDAAGPADFVAAAKRVEVECSGCSGTGNYHNHGRHDGECYRCHGKGFQNADDVRRNRAYDALNRMRKAG